MTGREVGMKASWRRATEFHVGTTMLRNHPQNLQQSRSHVEGFEDPKLEERNSKIQLTWMEIMEKVCHGCGDLFSGPAFGFSVILSLVLVIALGRTSTWRVEPFRRSGQSRSQKKNLMTAGDGQKNDWMEESDVPVLEGCYKLKRDENGI